MEDQEEYNYWECPNCGWDTCEYDRPAGDSTFLSVSSIGYGQEGEKFWTEYWKCPECDTEFEVENGT